MQVISTWLLFSVRMVPVVNLRDRVSNMWWVGQPCTFDTLSVSNTCTPCTLHTLHIAYPAYCTPWTVHTLHSAHPEQCTPCTSCRPCKPCAQCTPYRVRDLTTMNTSIAVQPIACKIVSDYNTHCWTISPFPFPVLSTSTTMPTISLFVGWFVRDKNALSSNHLL